MKNKGSDLKYINKSRNEGTQKSTAILMNATGSRYCPAYLQTETGLRKNRRNTEFLCQIIVAFPKFHKKLLGELFTY